MDFFGHPIDQVPTEALPVVAMFLVAVINDAVMRSWEAEYAAAAIAGYAPGIFG